MSKCTDSNREGQDHTVTITYENGVVSVSNADLSVCVNDTITFSCKDYPWAVQFVGMGKPKSKGRQQPPVQPLQVAGGAAGESVVTVQKGASSGKTWDYVVAVYANGDIVTVDPDIVIGARS
jgi:hypothetical protein